MTACVMCGVTNDSLWSCVVSLMTACVMCADGEGTERSHHRTVQVQAGDGTPLQGRTSL